MEEYLEKQVQAYQDNLTDSEYRMDCITYLWTVIIYNRNFSSQEFDDSLAEIKKRYPDVYDKLVEVHDGTELYFHHGDMNEEIFEQALVQLKNNFSLERIADLKRIGNEVYPPNIERVQTAVEENSTESEVIANNQQSQVDYWQTPEEIEKAENTMQYRFELEQYATKQYEIYLGEFQDFADVSRNIAAFQGQIQIMLGKITRESQEMSVWGNRQTTAYAQLKAELITTYSKKALIDFKEIVLARIANDEAPQSNRDNHGSTNPLAKIKKKFKELNRGE
ncbi:MAG: hypothetical protein ACRC17_01815 [Culicoidibacterales bacterium]